MKLCHNTDIMFSEARPCPVAEAKASHLISDLSYSSCSVLPDQVACERGHLHGSVLNRELIVGDVVSSVFYAVATPESIPDSLRSRSLRLELNHHVLHPQHAQPVTGWARVELAYRAGRQAAKVLRNEDTRQGLVAYSSVRRPLIFVVLRGLKSPNLYPCSFWAFTEYKSHISDDVPDLCPAHVHVSCVSESFFSRVEAQAYCVGAGLPGLMLPARIESKVSSCSPRKRASEELALDLPVSIKSSCDARHVVPRPEPRVFLKSVEEQFVAATADGKKFFECSKGKHMFKKLLPGDLLVLVQTKSRQRAVAVGQVGHSGSSCENNRALLYERLPHGLHDSLDSYLKGAVTFSYVEFDMVYDLRDASMTAKDLLAHGSLGMDPRKNFGMGMLEVVESSGSSIEKLLKFLDAQTIRWAPFSGKGVHVGR